MNTKQEPVSEGAVCIATKQARRILTERRHHQTASRYRFQNFPKMCEREQGQVGRHDVK